MTTQSLISKKLAAKSLIEPVLREEVLPVHVEERVYQHLENDKYIEALETAIHFD